MEPSIEHGNVQLLGTFFCKLHPNLVPKFRSRYVNELLALLILNRGKTLRRQDVARLLWTDSDGDKQAQSFRRALSDLRDTIEPEDIRGQILQTHQDGITITENCFDCDIDRFKAGCAEALSSRSVDLGRDMIALYSGELLQPWSSDWILPFRL